MVLLLSTCRARVQNGYFWAHFQNFCETRALTQNLLESDHVELLALVFRQTDELREDE